MKTNKLTSLLRKGNFVVPLYLYQLRDKFEVSVEEFIFLIYLTNLGDRFLFDVESISKELNMNLQEIMANIDTLSEKDLINVEVVKNEQGIMEEYISLAPFNNKLEHKIVDELVETKEETNIYELIEKDFGRTLSPTEYEIINAWLENFNEELIIEALKETVFNGVNNLRYMDKILYSWSNKGLKTKQDVSEASKKFRENKAKEEKIDLSDIEDYDWFNE